MLRLVEKADGLIELGTWLRCSEALDKWIESLERSVELDPDTRDVVREIGDHMAQLGRWEEKLLARSLDQLVGGSAE